MTKCVCGSSATAPICEENEKCSFCMTPGGCADGTQAFEFACVPSPPSCGEDQNLMEPATGDCTCGVGLYPFPHAVLDEDDDGNAFASRCHQQVAHMGAVDEQVMHPCDPRSATVCKAGEMCRQ